GNRILSSHRYVVRAKLLVNESPIFVTDVPPPVLTGGKGRAVELLLVRSGPGVGETGPLGSLPKSYKGAVPCSACQALRHELVLYPDRVFFLRTTKLGKGTDGTVDDIGTWSIFNDRRTLALSGARQPQGLYAIRGEDTLRKLDVDGQELKPASRYELKKT